MEQDFSEFSRPILQEMGVQVTNEQAGLFRQYLTLLDKWNQIYNITSVTPKSMWVSTHLYDSCSIICDLPRGFLLDIGTGGGFPGLVIAIAQPGRDVVLLDRSEKKTTFLKQVVIELGLKNVVVETSRIETFDCSKQFDVIVSRAFSELKIFLRSASRFCDSGGALFAMKGKYPSAELAEIPKDKVRQVKKLNVPKLNAERHIVELAPEGDI
jgi:16S rRNA (guanine527-N7)-methyltransferase